MVVSSDKRLGEVDHMDVMTLSSVVMLEHTVTALSIAESSLANDGVVIEVTDSKSLITVDRVSAAVRI